MGNSGDALKYFEQCVAINPKSDASYYQMAQIVIAANDLKNGKLYAEKALSVDEGNIWYLMMLAGIYYQEKNVDSAIVYYEKAAKYFPEKENLQLTLGNLYSENREFEKANMKFRDLEDKVGPHESVILSSVKNLMAAGKYDEALIKVNELLKIKPEEILYNGLLAEIYSGQGDEVKAMEVYNMLMLRYPDDPQIQLSLADFLISHSQFDDLFQILTTISLNSKIGLQDKVALFVRLLDIPDFIISAGDRLSVSLMVLEAEYKDDNIVPLLRADIMIKQLKYDEAESRLEELVKVNADNYYAWEKLLFLYLQKGDYVKLMKRGEECARLFNRSFIAKVLYANGAIETGNYPVAIEELRKAEILAGDNKSDLMQILTMKADVYYRMKDYTKAFEIFEQALVNNSEDLTVLNNYAYYLAEQDLNLRYAEEMSERVVEKERTNTTYLDTYAWVLYKRGKLNEAAKIMERIISSDEKPDAEWFEHYGFILKRQKKYEEAVKMWRIALDIDSSKDHLKNEIENCEK
jgi:tetratricopeptide (TPR) repeat protein